MQKRMGKKGISEVVTTVLMVLLALGAILLVWFLVRNLISNAGEQIDLSKLTLSFTIPGNSVYVNQPLKSVSFVVQRQAGAGTVSGLKVIVTDTGGQSVTQNVVVALGELESKSVSISYLGSSLGQIAKVSVAPIVKSASGNEQTGSVAAEYSVTSTNMHTGALSLSGSSPPNNPYVSAFNSLPSSQVTVSIWININSVPNGWRIVNHKWVSTTAANGPLDWLMIIYSSGPQFGMCTNNSYQVLSFAPTIQSGIWYNVVGTYDGVNTMHTFVNGVDGTPANLAAQGMSTKTLDITGGIDIGSGFSGMIKDLRVYNRVLTADEIKSVATDNLGTVGRTNLVGWYKFDEGTGAIAKDSSGNGNDMTLGTGYSWVSG